MPQRDHIQLLKSEHLEMAGMICSFEHFTNTKNDVVYHC